VCLAILCEPRAFITFLVVRIDAYYMVFYTTFLVAMGFCTQFNRAQIFWVFVSSPDLLAAVAGMACCCRGDGLLLSQGWLAAVAGMACCCRRDGLLLSQGWLAAVAGTAWTCRSREHVGASLLS
jgi:hypothetical protein